MLIDAARFLSVTRFLWWTLFGERIAERRLWRELHQMAQEEMIMKSLTPVIEIHVHPVTRAIINEINLHTVSSDRAN